MGALNLKTYQSLWDAQAILQINTLNLQIRPAGLWLRGISCAKMLGKLCLDHLLHLRFYFHFVLVGGDFWCVRSCLLWISTCSWFCLRRLIQMCDSLCIQGFHSKFIWSFYNDRPPFFTIWISLVSNSLIVLSLLQMWSKDPFRVFCNFYSYVSQFFILVCCHDECVTTINV